MHTNHRRKKPSHHNPRKGAGWSNCGYRSLCWERRHFWHQARGQVNRLLHVEKWDALPLRYLPTILWDIW